MMKAKRGFRLALCGAVLGAVYLGLAASAMAWNEPLWVSQFGTEGEDVASGAATDTAGNVYLSGYTGSLNPGSVSANAWVAKYDAAGNPLWKQPLATTDKDYANAVATDAKGNVYLTGHTEGSFDGAWFGGPPDAWVAKYSAQR